MNVQETCPIQFFDLMLCLFFKLLFGLSNRLRGLLLQSVFVQILRQASWIFFSLAASQTTLRCRLLRARYPGWVHFVHTAPVRKSASGWRTILCFFRKTNCHAEATGVCVRFNIAMFSILPARCSAQNAKCVRSWIHTIVAAHPICRFRMTHYLKWKYTFLTPSPYPLPLGERV